MLAFAATSSPWIAFCDADDVVGTGWLTAISQALDEHAFVSGGVELEMLNSRWNQMSRGLSFSNRLTVFEGMFPVCKFMQYGRHSQCIRVGRWIRRESAGRRGY